MKVYTYSEARQNLSELLNQAQTEEVVIKRRDGTIFSVKAMQPKASPFDISGIDARVAKETMLEAIRECRETEQRNQDIAGQ